MRKRIGSGFDNPVSISAGIFGDVQLLIPGIGGGTALGLTANGQLYIEFTAQAEFGPVGNISIGVTGGFGRNQGDRCRFFHHKPVFFTAHKLQSVPVR